MICLLVETRQKSFLNFDTATYLIILLKISFEGQGDAELADLLSHSCAAELTQFLSRPFFKQMIKKEELTIFEGNRGCRLRQSEEPSCWSCRLRETEQERHVVVYDLVLCL